MNPHLAHVINSSTLILLGAWGFFETELKSALLPVFLGVVLLSFSNGIKYDNKDVAYVVVVLVVMAIIALLIFSLPTALKNNNVSALIRSGSMLITAVLALVYYIRLIKKLST